MRMTEEDRSLRGNGQPIEPIAAPIPEASRISGLSRSEIYRRLAAGDIRAVKSGSRTLILLDSLREHLASLPAATFRAPKVA
jgi:excisionase family DNA binding protein